MKSSRRSFVKNTGISVVGMAVLPSLLTNEIKKKELVGIQLYSIRENMKKDPAGTLQELASMGYEYVEHANYIDRKFYGYSASEFKKLLDGLNLKMRSGHTVMLPAHWDAVKNDFTDAWKYTVEDAAVVGQQYVISPSLDTKYRTSYDELKSFMDVFNRSGELCKKSGMQFGYHNHDFEFSQKLNGQTMYDIILKNTDPDLVIQQLDTGNLYNGGAKAIDIVRQYPGRFMSLHVKDEIAAVEGNEKYESTILGAGVVNLKEVADLVRKQTKNVHYIIEQESYQGKAPLDCARQNLVVMKKWRFTN